jgi:hypothetical protein
MNNRRFKEMKRFFMIPIVAVLGLISCFNGVAYAQESEVILPDPGTTPDSSFYFMDKLGKQISLLFTFNSGEKVEKTLRYADERMAEIDAMLAQNKIKEATRATKEYQYCLETATKYMERARLKGIDVSEKVALMTEKHLGYLCENSGNASEDAQRLMTQTRERAMTCQETALKNMAQGDPEKAAQCNLQMMERHLNRIRVQAEEAKGEAVQARLEVYNRLRNLGEEISQIAKGLGDETTVDQLVGQATAYHLQVLAEVQQQVQEQARQEVDEAIQNCIQNHEQLVNRLQAQNQLGQVPEEVPMPDLMSNQMGQNGSPGGTQRGR